MKPSPKLKKFVTSWLVNTLAVLLTVMLLRDHIRYDKPVDLFAASLLLGILNAFLRPIIMLLALPLLIFTLGLFMFVINALILYFVGQLLPGFHVDGFWWAFWGALIISVVSVVLNVMIGGNARVEIRRGGGPPRQGPPGAGGGGGGPVIDV
jgi:putative membrane protein